MGGCLGNQKIFVVQSRSLFDDVCNVLIQIQFKTLYIHLHDNLAQEDRNKLINAGAYDVSLFIHLTNMSEIPTFSS